MEVFERVPRLREGGRVVRMWIDGVVPAPKGNSKRVVPVMRGGRQVHVVVPSSADAKREREVVKRIRLIGPAPPEPALTGPLALDVVFVLPVPKSWPKWRREAALAGHVYPYSDASGSAGSKPDRGNLLKLIEDALEAAGWVRNDSQFVTGRVAKVYGPEPGYACEIAELEEVSSREDWKAWATRQP